ncbi:MAG: hydrogenase small subunit [Desulfuromonadaceae bacterium]
MDRREFLKVASALVAGMALPLRQVEALVNVPAEKKPRVAWLQNQDCTGCSTSFVNSDTLLQFLTEIVNVVAHPNLSFASGHSYHDIWEDVLTDGAHVIVAEGTIPLAQPKTAMTFGKTAAEFSREAFEAAGLILCVGTCACYGGISAAAGNTTGATPVPDFLRQHCNWSKEKIASKVITLPGCPVHPEEIVGTVLDIVATGRIPRRNSNLSPERFYAELIHDHCHLRGLYENQDFAKFPGDRGCLFEVGCKGPVTYRKVCPSRKWNDGANWCVEARFGCKGCAHRDFFAHSNESMFTSPRDMEYIDWNNLMVNKGRG